MKILSYKLVDLYKFGGIVIGFAASVVLLLILAIPALGMILYSTFQEAVENRGKIKKR